MSSVVLPEGWCDTKLGAVVEYGKAVKKELSQVNNDTWILELEDIEKDNSKLIQRVLVADRPFKSTKNSFSKGDVLYGKLRPYLNKIIIADTDGVCTTEIIPINGEPLINNKFMFYWLKSESFLSYVNAVSYGVNMPRLGTTDGLAAPFYLAPLAEQKVIAAKLDELLAQVDIIKTRLTTIPTLLKRFRQSVLAAAVSGKLTAEWRGGENYKVDKNKLAYFVSIDIGHAFKSAEFTDSGVRLLRGQNIEPSALRWIETKYFPKDKLVDFGHLFINEGDIILAMDRPIISSGLKLARARKIDLPCVLVQRVARFKGFKDITPDFLYLLLRSVDFTNYIQPNQTGSDIPHISGKQILDYEVSLPPLEEQTEIVRRVEQLFAFADQIEQQVKNAQSRVNNLTQSILAKAFRGELTADWRAANPDLITGENSAQALLAKIKAERDKPKKTTKQQAMFNE